MTSRVQATFVALLVACMTAVTASGCSGTDLLNAVSPSDSYTLLRDIDYGPDPRQRFDVYLPTTSAPDKHVIVFVYGGAWRKGERRDYAFVAATLTAAGHAVVIPDYRLYPEATHPDFAIDVAAVIERLATITEFESLPGEQLPLQEVVLVGHSAGAHTVALVASDPSYLANSEIGLRALIGLAGPYDLPLDDPDVIDVFATVEDEASVQPPALARRGAHPPTLLLHGLADKRVAPRHSRRYAEALAEQAVPHRLCMLDGVGHVGIVAGIAQALTVLNAANEILVDYLDDLQLSAESASACEQRQARGG